MSLGFFILGALMMIVGFMAVWKTNWFLQNLGDIGQVFGAFNASWMSWKLFGVFLILFGFLIAFNILGLFFSLTLGRFLRFGTG